MPYALCVSPTTMLNHQNRTYYLIKPLIPRRLQIFLRRKLVQWKLPTVRQIWPINEEAVQRPEGWAGWPDGKRFALVLTHDVELARGHERCRDIMAMEKQMGFRSSFNFVPERYDVSAELRNELTRNGFEVGLHGLYHDGKYYTSRKVFRERAVKINRYLQEWECVGFRSPSMLCNLEWILDLNMEYDSSTFDTDPFEPQSEGMGTIFPFIVNGGPSRKAYVELPYTLVQDFTLFILMKEKTIDIWKKKLDWIAEKGGMALIITHPDYMSVNGKKQGSEEYPVGYYKSFLEYVQERYGGQYWHVLPREMSSFWTNTRQGIHSNSDKNSYSPSGECSALVKPRILMIVENAYPGDSRVRKEATALKGSFDITVISLKRNYDKWHEMVDGVEVFRVPEVVLAMNNIRNRFVRLSVSILNYALQYSFFTSVSASLFLLTHIKRRYKAIHAHNPPDTLFLVGLLGKLFSAKFVYDHHDLAPELYLSRYGGRTDMAHKILLMCEKISCKLADVVIATNSSYKTIEVKRHGIQPDKIHIVRNDPVMSEFCRNNGDSPGKSKKNSKNKNLLYIGSINPQDGVEGLLDALKYVVYDLGKKDILCRIVGDGDSLDGIKALAEKYNLMDCVEFTGYVYDRNMIKEYLTQADVCVEPAPDNELNRHSTFIKIMEYMAASKPIVAFDLDETRHSACGSALLVPPGDVKGFAMAVSKLLDDPNLCEELGRKGCQRVTLELTWEEAASNLKAAYKSLGLKK